MSTHRSHHSHHKRYTTNGQTIRTNTMSTVWSVDESTNRCLSGFLYAAWIFFMVVALILLIAAISLPSWVTGTGIFNENETPDEMEVGLFRQCENNSCESFSLVNANIGSWTGAAACFIISIIFLFVTIAIALMSVCFPKLLLVSKLLLSITNFFLVLVIILVPVGFAWLDDKCPTSGAFQCGLSCGAADGHMGSFTVCGPWTVGTATYVMVVGTALLFISTFFAACIRPAVITKKEIY